MTSRVNAREKTTVFGTVLILIRLIDVTAHSSVFGSSQSSLILNQREGCARCRAACRYRRSLTSCMPSDPRRGRYHVFCVPFSADRPRRPSRIVSECRRVCFVPQPSRLHADTPEHRNTAASRVRHGHAPRRCDHVRIASIAHLVCSQFIPGLGDAVARRVVRARRRTERALNLIRALVVRAPALADDPVGLVELGLLG